MAKYWSKMASKEGHISKTTNASVAAESKEKFSSAKVKYINTLSRKEKERYKAKLDILGPNITCPYDLPKSSWKDDPAEWWSVRFPDIRNCFLETLRAIYQGKAEELQVFQGLLLLR